MQVTLLTILLSFILCIDAENGILTSGNFVGEVPNRKETELTTIILAQRQMLLELAEDLKNTKSSNTDLKAQLNSQSAIIAMQQTDINELKEQIGRFSVHIGQLNAFVYELKEENNVLQKSIQCLTQAGLSDSLSERNDLSKNNIKEVSDGIDEKSEHFEQKATEDLRENMLSALLFESEPNDNNRKNDNKETNRRIVLNREGPVAFHAVNDRGEIPHLTIGQPVSFDTVLLNIGGVYHSRSSFFIAEQPGVYLFSASILSFSNPHQDCIASIVKNGMPLVRMYGHGDNGHHDQGSATAIVQLNAGDEVWVRIDFFTDISLYGNRYTSFTGVLLWNI